MAWKDNLREASFRGISFFVPSHELSGGRRLVTHEYPLRDEPYTEDLGLKAKRFSVEAYVVGDDYMNARDSLIEALNKNGEGELVHPYLGSITVQCDSYSMNESDSEGRMARFSMQFVESGESKYPSESNDYIADAEEAAGALDDAAAESFADSFDVSSLPEFISLDALKDLNAFFGKIGLDIANVQSFFSTPLSLARSIQGLFSIFTDGDRSFKQSAATVIQLGAYGDYKTSSRAILETALIRNHNAIISLIREAAAAEAVRCAVAADYETRDDAEMILKKITGVLDDEMDRTQDTKLYIAQSALRAEAVLALPFDKLPEVVHRQINRPLPSLVLAYETYGDALRADELVARNCIIHPGFVSGGLNMVSA